MPPSRQHLSGVGAAVEDLLVEAFVPEFSIEAFNEAILLRLARRDIVPSDTGLVLPFQDRPAGQFRAVVGHDGLRHAIKPNAAIQLPGDACA